MTESDQLQPTDTLDDRGTEDILDEGISPPEKLRGSTAKGVTAEEALEGETLEERLRQEEPDPTAQVEPDAVPSEEDADPSDQYAGDDRSGRLVEPDAAEEAAVHIQEEAEPDINERENQ